MSRMTRRDFIKLSGAGATAVTLSSLGVSGAAQAANGPRVVVVGGGFGGATCAKYLRRADRRIQVTLVEPNARYLTCPFSNYVIGGFRKLDENVQTYDALRTKHGVTVVHDTVTVIDPAGRKIKLRSGKTLSYDRLVVSPGIDFKWNAIPGYSEQASNVMPHAWKAGPQTSLLRRQLVAMKDGGLVVMVAPPNPFRCPPGPYERASVIAHYLKEHKPKSKIVILDAKDDFSKKGLFMAGWEKLYPGMIEWVAGSKGGEVRSVNARTLTVEGALDKYKAAVVNVIPPQTAGHIAIASGLADENGWCPVEPRTFESKKHPGIHVIGDASIAGALPKSGFAANSEAKIVAAAIAGLFRGESLADASYVNTCYSLLAPHYGISVAGVYRVTDQGIVQIEGGVSPKDAPDGFRADEAKYAYGWYASITADSWG